MAEFVDFLKNTGNNALSSIEDMGNTVNKVISIPVGLAGAAANIATGLGNFLSSPFSGIMLPIIAIGAIYVLKK